jgi:cobalt/nickel transport system permease protein
MHVPDGFLDAPTSLATGAIAVGAVGLSLRRSEAELRQSGPALAGLTAAFVFAAQMINFPVGAGTSGHLLGGVLAACLVGPWTAILVMTVVFLVQALLFADGGLTALGTNVLVMGIVTVLVGYGLTRILLRALPRRPRSVVPAAAVGAAISTPTAALVFTALYVVGGTVAIPLPALATAMIGWHLLIGIGEAIITAAILGAVVATRPDLVYAARGARPNLILVAADGTRRTVAADATPAGRDATAGTGAHRAAGGTGTRGFLAAGGLVTLVVAGLLSLAASGHPDGLEYVGEELGFGESAHESAAAGSPLAEYALRGLDGPLATSIAGVIGVLITLALGAAALWLVGRRRARSHARSNAGPAEAADAGRASELSRR